jgi:aspartate/methionine/tyrosine aminotransferase
VGKVSKPSIHAIASRLSLNERLQQAPRVGSRVTDARIEELVREGREVIPLKPYPSRPLPPHVLEAVEKAAQEPVNPPSRGIPEFRRAVAATLGSELCMEIDPDSNVLATCGSMHALFVIFLSVLNAGDAVLVPAPCYFLEGLIEPQGAQIIYVPMQEGEGYRWDFERIEAAINGRVRCIFLNTPANPTGYVLTRGDLESLAEIAERHNLLLVADESYDTLVYDGRSHLSVALIPEIRNRTVLVRSFTKSYAMPGWRVGFVIAPSGLTECFTKTLEWTMLYGAYVNQKAAAAALLGPRRWLAGVANDFQRARDFLCSGIERLHGFSCVKPAGGPFLFLNVKRLCCDGDRAATILLEEYGVPTTPGCYLRSKEHVRMAFGAELPVLQEALARLERAAERMRFQKG